MTTNIRVSNSVQKSQFISRDLSWLKFNFRVLDQTRLEKRSIFEKLKFLAITSSNLDEFFMIRVGSLYNYIDYDKERVDYSGLRETPFKNLLLEESQFFFQQQNRIFLEELTPEFKKNGFEILNLEDLIESEQKEVAEYFRKTVFPMLTPMVYDNYRTFPILRNNALIFGVVTKVVEESKEEEKLSFVQIPQNLSRFYAFERGKYLGFLPIEEIIRWKIHKLYRNVEIISTTLFRVTRSGDITLEENEEMEDDFIDEVKKKLKSRKTGRVVRIEVEQNYSEWMMRILKRRWQIDDHNVFIADKLIDFTGLFQIAFYKDFIDKITPTPKPKPFWGMTEADIKDINFFEYLKEKDIILHHPYNSIEPLLQLLEVAAHDPDVLAIKITIYRLAKNSRIITALQKAAERGVHVSVLFELKARFDEENNIREAERLQEAGCFVIHGISQYKTHTKLLLIVRKEGDKVTRYVHLSSGNYNENTARLYTDIALLTTNETYAQDVSEFFNVITGHSQPLYYESLITSPRDMRNQLIALVRKEAENARKGQKSGIIIKINSLEDREFISELYKASKSGVPIELIVRGICCLRPQREGLSESITVRSIVGEFLEHSRIYYFQNLENPLVYAGSADVMVRSFDRRIESIFQIQDKNLKNLVITILQYNLRDNVNAYVMQEDGSYLKLFPANDEEPFNIHKEFFNFYEQQKLPESRDIFYDFYLNKLKDKQKEDKQETSLKIE
ncbi:MAG: polyphosphate kinase 1 [Microscillaceae bacterium]|nr:polyphosphate kinase 1 [Microscillaceae bacterium]